MNNANHNVAIMEAIPKDVSGVVITPSLAVNSPAPAGVGPRNFKPAVGPSSRIQPFAWGSGHYAIPADSLDCCMGADAEDATEEIATLQRIATELGKCVRPLDGYFAYRTDWIRSNLRLNSERLLAPRFRPPLDPRQVPATLEQATYACDRQVVDLHWLHCTDVRIPIQQGDYADLLTASEFDCTMAENFARANVRVSHKVEGWLALNEFMQWQLASLQSTATRKRWGSIRRGEGRGTPGMPQVATALRVGRRSSDCAEIEELVMRWAVEKMLPGASASERSQLFALARGLPEGPPPHIFQRQQSAAIKRIRAALN